MPYKIPCADPYVTNEDARAVAKAVREKKLSQGKYTEIFEKKFAKYIGVKHAIAVCNATAGLHLALASLGVGPGDEVIVPSFSFVATANCVLYQGAKPIFADIDPLTYNIDPNDIKAKITDKTKAIIPVHYAGQSVDMDPLLEIAHERGIHVVEDAAEALGTKYKKRMIGSLGTIACFSFYPNKPITTGEGGVMTTRNDSLAEDLRIMRTHGQDRRYHNVLLGYNYRLTDLQAALGIIQLKRLKWATKKRVEKAAYYDKRIKEVFYDEIKRPYVAPYSTHVYAFYTIRFESKKIRDKVFAKMEKKGVETCVAFPPIHLQPIYQRLFKYERGYLPITEEVSDTILCLPIYSHINQKEQEYVISALKSGLHG